MALIKSNIGEPKCNETLDESYEYRYIIAQR